MDESGGSASIAGALGLSVEQCALSVELNGLQDELNGDDVVRASVGASEIALLREPRIVAEEVELDRLERGLWLLFEEAGDSNDGRKAPERMEACWIAVEACPCATYGDGDRGRRGSASMAGERTMTFFAVRVDCSEPVRKGSQHRSLVMQRPRLRTLEKLCDPLARGKKSAAHGRAVEADRDEAGHNEADRLHRLTAREAVLLQKGVGRCAQTTRQVLQLCALMLNVVPVLAVLDTHHDQRNAVPDRRKHLRSNAKIENLSWWSKLAASLCIQNVAL
eukprot:4162839-Pleurochrysis_carterae.AAC.2